MKKLMWFQLFEVSLFSCPFVVHYRTHKIVFAIIFSEDGGN